ncbi:hypothetical protein G7054_g9838 [Neopestalotiopsis clavispora]|nr:hypothetical protein G7054_g9838 [Neopestalotiopsis clavispora]
MVHRIGFTDLGADSPRENGSYPVNIIFVHGLKGHPQTTWEDWEDGTSDVESSTSRNETPGIRTFFRVSARPKAPRPTSHDSNTSTGRRGSSKIFWPRDYLAVDIPDARIWTYGYNADVIGMFKANNQNSVSQHGQDLAVKFERDIDNEYPVVFVAHSLGGIVVKDALHRSEACRARTRFVVFLGTPHRGSSFAGWGAIASNLASLALQDSNKKVLKTLEVNGEVLDNIQGEFQKILQGGDIRVHSFQEAQGISGVKGFSGKVVDDFSSKIGLAMPFETVESIDANHMQMARCRTRMDPQYRAIFGVLKQFIRRGSSATPAGIPAEHQVPLVAAQQAEAAEAHQALKGTRQQCYEIRSHEVPPRSDFAQKLLYDLKFSVENIGSRPIMFVAHSMGGLIVKRAYTQGGNDPQYRTIVKAINAIIFLSTPHRGSNFAEVLQRILQVSLVSAPKEHINDLLKKSHALQRINDAFRHVVKGLSIVSFYETEPTVVASDTKRVMIVDQDSSVLGYPGEVTRGLSADHHTICKYTSREDPNYITVRDCLRSQVARLVPLSQGSSEASTTPTTAADIREMQELFLVTEPPDTDYIAYRDRWTSGTCEWILSESPFQRWVDDADQAPRLLWVHGGAGCGKSIMASFIVNHLVEADKSCQYSFIRFGDRKKRSLDVTLRLLAFQIAQVMPNFHHEVSRAPHSLNRSAEALTIWQRLFKIRLFKQGFTRPLFWVIDGLDESEAPRSGIKMFAEILTAKVPIRVLIVSRRTLDMDAEFKKLPIDAKWDMLSFRHNTDDQKRFLDAEVDERPTMPGFKKKITQQLLDMSQGNFLWLSVMVDRINRCQTSDAINQALKQLPAGMRQLYERMMQPISAQEVADKTMTMKILTWISCATRPLQLEELTDALEVPLQTFSIKELGGGFVVVDNYGNVSLIHNSAREYLLGSKHHPGHIARRPSHFELYSRCLRSLATRGLRREIARGSIPPLLEYASKFWSDHLILSAMTSNESIEPLVEFLRSPNVLIWINSISKTGQLHVLVRAFNNLSLFVRKLSAIESIKLPSGRTSNDLELIELWATDLAKVVGKFGSQLRHMPDSIFKIIPCFCPPQSIIFKQFGRKEERNLEITGLSSSTWDDSQAHLSLDPGQKATGLVAQGPWIAVSTELENGYVVLIYDATHFQEMRRIEPGERVRLMQLNSLGSLLLTHGLSTLHIWNVATGICVAEAKAPLGRPSTAVFAEDDSVVMIGYDDKRVWSMSLSSNRPRLKAVTRIMQKSSGGRPTNSPSCMAISPDGLQLALGYRSAPVTIWDIDYEITDLVAEGHGMDEVAELIWHPFKGELFGRELSGHIFKWLPGPDAPQKIRTTASILAISSDGSFLAAGNHLGAVKLLTTTELTFIHQVVAQDPIVGLAFSADNQQLFEVRSRYGIVWQPAVLMRLSQSPPTLHDGEGEAVKTNGSPPSEVRYSMIDSVSALMPHRSGELFLMGTERGAVSLHDISLRRKVQNVEKLTSFGIEQIAWSPDGRFACLADASRTVSVLSVGTKTGSGKAVVKLARKFSINDLEDNITQLVFHKNAPMILVSSNTTSVILSINGKSVHKIVMDVPRGRWMVHPTNVDILIYATPWKMAFYGWSSSKQVKEFPTIQLPAKSFVQNQRQQGFSPSVSSRVLDSQPPGNAILHDSDISIQNMMSSLSHRYTLIEATAQVQGQRCNTVHLLDTRHLFSSPGTTAKTAPGATVTTVPLPDLVINRMKRPIMLLSNGSQEILVFVDCRFWVSSWMIPSGTPLGKEDNTEVVIKTHFCLPGDWTPGCLPLMQAFDDGTILSPRNGEIAIIRFNGYFL